MPELEQRIADTETQLHRLERNAQEQAACAAELRETEAELQTVTDQMNAARQRQRRAALSSMGEEKTNLRTLEQTLEQARRDAAAKRTALEQTHFGVQTPDEAGEIAERDAQRAEALSDTAAHGGKPYFWIAALVLAALCAVLGYLVAQPLYYAAIALAAAALVLLIVMAVSRRIKDIMVILILGMMFGSGVSSMVEILQYLSSEAALKSFVIWTMGSLGDVTGSQLALLLPVVTAGLALAVAVIKPLNLLLLGENYARTMGLNVQRTRTLIFLSTVLLAGTVTAFCGPVSFLGLAVPHIARMLLRTSTHRILLPASMLVGAALTLGCNLLCTLPGSGTLIPINVITPLVGTPVIMYVILGHNRK